MPLFPSRISVLQAFEPLPPRNFSRPAVFQDIVRCKDRTAAVVRRQHPIFIPGAQPPRVLCARTRFAFVQGKTERSLCASRLSVVRFTRLHFLRRSTTIFSAS